jgi:hypothetical protein
MIKKHPVGMALTSIMLAFVFAAPATTDASQSSHGLSSRQQALLLSSTPKTVVWDASTGQVVSVTANNDSQTNVSPEISGGTTCSAGDGCYTTPTVNATYHDRSYYGSAGTFTGSWPQRDGWRSGNYSASVCWQSNCSSEVGPNSSNSFGGAVVTGTSFTIY